MTAVSQIPAYLRALLACFRAALGEGQVVDGPLGLDDTIADYVLVGATDIEDDEWQTAAEGSQGWPWLGHTTRQLDETVHCVAVSLSGDGLLEDARDAAFGIVQIVADAIVADPSLGGSSTWTLGLTSYSVRQKQDRQRGGIVQVPFDVEFTTYQ